MFITYGKTIKISFQLDLQETLTSLGIQVILILNFYKTTPHITCKNKFITKFLFCITYVCT